MIVISPYSKRLRNGKRNPKDYPYWQELLNLLKDDEIIQIGVDGEEQLVYTGKKFNSSLKEITELLKQCDTWISVDNFLPHLAHHINKPGVVIWGISDPKLFGYEENLNILKNRKYLRDKQFDIWEAAEYNKDAFLEAKEVYRIMKEQGFIK